MKNAIIDERRYKELRADSTSDPLSFWREAGKISLGPDHREGLAVNLGAIGDVGVGHQGNFVIRSAAEKVGPCPAAVPLRIRV